ncbi:MAG: hypothetical protein ACYC5M_08800 [Anaerolineae bacterium]
MLKIHCTNESLTIQAARYRLQVNLETGQASLATGDGGHLFDTPLDVRVTLVGGDTQMQLPLQAQAEGQVVTLRSGAAGPWEDQTMRLECAPDWFELAYSGRVGPGQSAIVQETRYLTRGTHGMQLKHCWEGLQPTPQGGKEAEECYLTPFPRCSAGSYYSPPPLVLFQHLPAGWVGMGLTSLPNAKRFELGFERCLFVDSPAGHLTFGAGETYAAPGVMCIFPEDGWSGLRLFHDTLAARGLVDSTPIWERNYPDWWKRPIYCTYGDQMLELQYNEYTAEDWGAPGFNDDYVRRVVQRAEERLGYREFTVLIDAFWQDPWDADPKPSERFPRLRALIDWLHERGHRVMLWVAPFTTRVTDGCGALAARHDILERPVRGEQVNLDWTAPGFEAYAEEMAATLFGSGPDALDADGVKMDSLQLIREPAEAHYRRPELGMGIREVQRFLEVFVGAARQVRPDVCINFSAADPRVAPWISQNRLHDIQSSWQERDRRARISAQAAPNLIMDTDAFCMYSHWLEPTYLNTAIMGTMTIGYSELIHDGMRLSDQTMQTLGHLARLSAQRPWGQPEFVDYGHWRLRRDGRVMGESFEQRAVLLFPDESAGYVVTFQDAEVEVCTHGRAVGGVSPLPEGLTIQGDRVRARWMGGQVYTLTVTGE